MSKGQKVIQEVLEDLEYKVLRVNKELKVKQVFRVLKELKELLVKKVK